MTIRKILLVARVLFLGISLVCAGTAYVWHWHTDFVDRVDGWFVRRHTHDAFRDLNRAKDLSADDRPDDAIRVLEELVPGLRDAGRGNRHEPARSASLALLSDLLAKRGDVDRALVHADELYAHDDRNLLNVVRRAELLDRLGRQNERLVALEEAYRVGSRNSRIAAAYLAALADSGSSATALGLVLRDSDRLLPRLPDGRWDCVIRPATGAVIRAGTTPDLAASGRLQWGVPITPEPVALQHVRLDLPSQDSIRLESVSVVLRTVAGEEHVLDLGHLMRSPRLEHVGDTLVYSGGKDPYLVLTVPKSMRANPVREVEFRAQVRAFMSPELRALLIAAVAQQDRDALIAEFGEAAVRRLEGALQ